MKEILKQFEYLPMLSEFVKVCDTKNAINDTPITLMEFICQYTNFITQPLTKGMFVPCVDDEPFNYSKHGLTEQFQQAKDRVLFDIIHDIEIVKKELLNDYFKYLQRYTTIEDAINAGVKLKLKG